MASIRNCRQPARPVDEPPRSTKFDADDAESAHDDATWAIDVSSKVIDAVGGLLSGTPPLEPFATDG